MLLVLINIICFVTLLFQDMEKILSESTDYDELAYVWSAWRNSTGKPIRKLYNQFIDISNKAADVNGSTDNTEIKSAKRMFFYLAKF